MTILFSSDLHGNEKAYKRFISLLSSENYEFGILSGDLTCPGCDNSKQLKQILKSTDKTIYYLMGNMDSEEWAEDSNLVFINQRKISLGAYSIVGYQYTNPFSGGIFEKGEIEQETDLDQLKLFVDDKTILVTHGPAYGMLDRIRSSVNVGSKALNKLIDERKPLLHLFGHIHEAAGIEGFSVNGAYWNLGKFVSVDVKTRSAEFI